MQQQVLQFDAYSNILTLEMFNTSLKEFRAVVKNRKSLNSKNSSNHYKEYIKAREREMELYCILADCLPYFKPSEKLWAEIMTDSWFFTKGVL